MLNTKVHFVQIEELKKQAENKAKPKKYEKNGRANKQTFFYKVSYYGLNN